MAMIDMLQDLRFALRAWRRSPGFAAVVATVLALGIGANTAMFTLVNSLLFNPLPGRGAELIGIYSHDRTTPDSYRRFSYPNYVDLRDDGSVFDGLLAHTVTMVGIPSGETTRRAFADVVSSNFFAVAGVPLAAGRTFTAAEERPGAAIPVAIVRYDYWRRTNFDASLIGRTIRLNTSDFTIVGVAAEGFTGTTPLFGPEVWIPLGMFDAMVTDELKPDIGLADRRNAGLLLAGRLKPRLSAETAGARLEAISAGLAEAYPDANRNQLITLHPLSRLSLSTGPQSDAPLIIASGVAMLLPGAVLLISCLNVANMFLARASARRKEIAIRLALGSSRSRLVTQLITEGSFLALLGAAGGVAVASWTIRAATRSLALVLPFDLRLSTPLDLRVLLAVTVFAIASTLGFALGPALTVSRPELTSDLKDDGSLAGGRTRVRTRSWLVVGQIAVSVVLVTIGASVAVAARRAISTDPGFRYDGLLLVSTDAAMAGYDERAGRASLQRLLDRIRELPGVVSASAASLVPFGDSHEGRGVERPGIADPGRRAPTYTVIGADYFKSIGLPLLRGREFTETETRAANDPRVAVIDQRLADRLFANEDPVGQSIRLSAEGTSPPGPLLEVVGVVPSVQDELIERVPTAHLYVPLSAAYRGAMSLHVRTTSGQERALVETLADEIRRVDPRLPVLELSTMRRFHERGLILWTVRASGILLSTFGVVALVLAAIGVYGVRAFVVSQRRREIGIRMALGASRQNVLRLLVVEGGVMAAAGLALGTPVALAIAFASSRLTNGTITINPLALAAGPVVLAAAAAIASWIPARRAARMDPMSSLRTGT